VHQWWAQPGNHRLAQDDLFLTDTHPKKEATSHTIEDQVRQSLQESVKGILEIGTIWLKPLRKVKSLITKTRNVELLSATLEDPRGLILITPHLGNWELLAYYFCRYRKVTAMYKPSGLPDLDKLIQDARARAWN
jgi:KDO2-lipid IV(A) lauroyltransferase